ncbi:hypothetical protein KOR42_25800 [Thalassoglobus neptunius]|uniref:LTXXQ motif protein n=1 Tax=Thalassoglobus neptunius TaxID=1938619 RepID=A0A5C5WZP5_9PLAN|nr:hypothetical protein [Thalassoglobus neptunius]TWT55769.1 hypothetical protein KOR42_25800 [Thalassoglobus neptunius]
MSCCVRRDLQNSFVAVLSLILFLNTSLQAQDQKEAFTRQQEMVALEFAKEHHRELHKLISQLKEMDPQRYESAIAELFESSERLNRFKERVPDRYETEIELWKIDSRVRLLVARSMSGMEEEAREQIRRLLIRRNRVRATQLAREKKKLEERIDRMEQQIDDLQTNTEQLAENELNRLLRSARNRSAAKQRSEGASAKKNVKGQRSNLERGSDSAKTEDAQKQSPNNRSGKKQ